MLNRRNLLSLTLIVTAAAAVGCNVGPQNSQALSEPAQSAPTQAEQPDNADQPVAQAALGHGDTIGMHIFEQPVSVAQAEAADLHPHSLSAREER